MELTNDYIRGLVDGEGCFTFYTGKIVRNGMTEKIRIPAFAISMHERDKELIQAVRDHFGIKNAVYTFRPYLRDGCKRGSKATLVIREFGRLKNVIIPFFYKKLKGYKAKQFESWLERMGADPLVPESYKLLYRLHKSGYYDKNQKFVD